MMGSERVRDAELDEEEAMVRQALDEDLEGLGRPLKVRMFLKTRLSGSLFPADEDTTDDQISRRGHYGVQDRQSASVLPGDNGKDDWSRSGIVWDIERVS